MVSPNNAFVFGRKALSISSLPSSAASRAERKRLSPMGNEALFLKDAANLALGSRFLFCLILASPFLGFFYLSSN